MRNEQLMQRLFSHACFRIWQATNYDMVKTVLMVLNHKVCDAWPVRRQTYGYLPSITAPTSTEL